MLEQELKGTKRKWETVILDEMKTNPDPAHEYTVKDFAITGLDEKHSRYHDIKIANAVKYLGDHGLIYVEKRRTMTPGGNKSMLHFRQLKPGETPAHATVKPVKPVKQNADPLANLDAKLVRRLYALLDKVFDEASHAYVSGWDEAKVAHDIGLPLEAVAHIRQEAYGDLKPAFPVTIVKRSEREQLQIERKLFNGKDIIAIRSFYKNSGDADFFPGKSGITFNIAFAEQVIDGLCSLLTKEEAVKFGYVLGEDAEALVASQSTATDK